MGVLDWIYSNRIEALVYFMALVFPLAVLLVALLAARRISKLKAKVFESKLAHDELMDESRAHKREIAASKERSIKNESELKALEEARLAAEKKAREAAKEHADAEDKKLIDKLVDHGTGRVYSGIGWHGRSVQSLGLPSRAPSKKQKESWWHRSKVLIDQVCDHVWFRQNSKVRHECNLNVAGVLSIYESMTVKRIKNEVHRETPEELALLFFDRALFSFDVQNDTEARFGRLNSNVVSSHCIVYEKDIEVGPGETIELRARFEKAIYHQKDFPGFVENKPNMSKRREDFTVTAVIMGEVTESE